MHISYPIFVTFAARTIGKMSTEGPRRLPIDKMSCREINAAFVADTTYNMLVLSHRAREQMAYAPRRAPTRGKEPFF